MEQLSQPIIAALLNGGGLSLLAAALFYLHITSLKRFSEELAIERKFCQDNYERLVDSLEKLSKEVRSVWARKKETDG